MSRVRTKPRNFYKKQRKISIPFRKIIKLLVIISFLLLLLSPIYLIPRIIKIKSIGCTSQFGPCSQVLTDKISTIDGKSYLQTKKLLRNILEEQLSVSSYNLKFQFPSSIEIYAVEKKAEIAFVEDTNTSEFFFVDKQGLVVGTSENTTLPIVLMRKDFNFVIGQKLPADLFFASKLLYESFKMYNCRLAILEENRLSIEVENGIRVIMPLDGDIDLLFGSLNVILSRLNSSTSNSRIESALPGGVTEIDLRYKNPVLR